MTRSPEALTDGTLRHANEPQGRRISTKRRNIRAWRSKEEEAQRRHRIVAIALYVEPFDSPEEAVLTNARDIAARFAKSWEDAWNSGGADAAAKLYTQDSVLVGAVIGVGKAEIERLLGLLYRQGWTKIGITVVDARRVDAVVLVVSEFVAEGFGPNAGKSLRGKSSHVLTLVGDTWLSAMHTIA